MYQGLVIALILTLIRALAVLLIVWVLALVIRRILITLLLLLLRVFRVVLLLWVSHLLYSCINGYRTNLCFRYSKNHALLGNGS